MQARAEGFNARMLPGISAEDCLFANLGADPGTHGCQSFEATSFLLRKPKFDTLTHLILWQILFGIQGIFIKILIGKISMKLGMGSLDWL